MNHESFVQAILETPDDDLLRLAFADWLEERGDSRAEFLRVEAALLNRPPGDADGTLETRRRELVKAIDPEWIDLVRRLLLNPIDELRRVLPPPRRLLHAVGDWAQVERSLGLSLPSDYKEYISTYRSGTAGCIEIVSPFGLDERVHERWQN